MPFVRTALPDHGNVQNFMLAIFVEHGSAAIFEIWICIWIWIIKELLRFFVVDVVVRSGSLLRFYAAIFHNSIEMEIYAALFVMHIEKVN